MLGLNVGIDLGTTTVIVYVEGRGIVLSEPSIVAYKTENSKILSLGAPALKMLGRTSDAITLVRPLKHGVVSDFTATEQLLRYVIQKVCGNKIIKPNIIVCMPSTVTSLEKRTILDVITASGAGKACLIEEPLAAAVGAGIDIMHPHGFLVVDIGGGTSDAAVITMGSVCLARSVRVAGNTFSEAIIRYIRRERDVYIGELTAERIKKTVGCAYLRPEEIEMVAKGKNSITGMPVSFDVNSTEIYLAIREQINQIIKIIVDVLEQTPPELAADVIQEGIILTGGGAKLTGLPSAVEEATGIKTRLATDSANCVANGIGQVLKNMEFLDNMGYLFKSREEITGIEEN